MARRSKGQPAPLFIANDYLGNNIRLVDYRGKATFISFFRGASCPFCNMRVHQLIKNQARFQSAGLEIITFFSGSAEEIGAYAGTQSAPFPLIPDQELTIYKRFGVEQDKWGMMKTMSQPMKIIRMMFSGFFSAKSIADRPIVPADFVLDKDLRIV